MIFISLTCWLQAFYRCQADLLSCCLLAAVLRGYKLSFISLNMESQSKWCRIESDGSLRPTFQSKHNSCCSCWKWKHVMNMLYSTRLLTLFYTYQSSTHSLENTSWQHPVMIGTKVNQSQPLSMAGGHLINMNIFDMEALRSKLIPFGILKNIF